MQGFIQKYTPKNLDEIIGNKKQISLIRYWAKDHKKPLFIYGAPGIGKTLTAILLAKEMNWSLYHTDASDMRNKEAMQNLVMVATTSNTLFAKKRLILIDEIDAVNDKRGGDDAGCFGELQKIADKSIQPIIFIANDPYENKKLRPIFEKCEQIKFDLPNKLSIQSFAKDICEKENIDYDLVALKAIVEKANNDIRALLLDLETVSLSGKITLEDIDALGERKKDEDVFKVLQKIFFPKDFYETRNAIDNMSIDWELLFAWVDENIPRQYKNSKNLADALECMSRADMFNGRIHATNWVLLKYIFDYLTIGVAYAKKEPEARGFTPFVFPTILQGLSGSKKERIILNSIIGKFQEKIHASKHIIHRDYLPIIQIIASSNKYTKDLVLKFGLTLEEIKLLGAKITEKKFEEIVN